MATVLDLSLLEPFNFIFPVIIVFAIVFAVLQKTKVLGDNKAGINAIVAAMMSLLVLLSQTARDLLNFMIPWFAVLVIFFILLMLAFMTLGAGEKDIFNTVKNNTAVVWTVMGIIIVIMLAGFGSVLGQQFTSMAFQGGEVTNTTSLGEGVATTSYEQNLMATIFHPKVLGIIILFAIVIFSVLLLTI